MIVIETFERGSSPRYRPAASPIVIQDRHVMIGGGARQHHKPALSHSPALDQAMTYARRRDALDHLRVDQSPPRDGHFCLPRSGPIELDTPFDRFPDRPVKRHVGNRPAGAEIPHSV